MPAMLQTKGLFPVYRLEEYGGLLQEGGGGLPVLLLRARSYKTKAEGWHQGNAPILFKGWISVFFDPYNRGPGLGQSIQPRQSIHTITMSAETEVKLVQE